MEASDPDRSVASNDAPEPVSRAARAWLASVQQLVNDFAQLAGLEAQRAGKALAWMVGLAAAAIVCVFTVWGLLFAAGAMWLVETGLRWSLALLIAGVANAVLGLILVVAIRRLAGRLSFPTVRRIIGATDGQPKGSRTAHRG